MRVATSEQLGALASRACGAVEDLIQGRLLRTPDVLVQKDTVFRGGRDSLWRLPKEARKPGKSGQAGATDTKERTASQSATAPHRIADREHRPPPPQEGESLQ